MQGLVLSSFMTRDNDRQPVGTIRYHDRVGLMIAMQSSNPLFCVKPSLVAFLTCTVVLERLAYHTLSHSLRCQILRAVADTCSEMPLCPYNLCSIA